ncbi:MAG: molybdopterin-dependent oxidoreductase, partial [bacterium]|nr:molybdopterin-dependent oxidoreductase [bacterium]
AALLERARPKPNAKFVRLQGADRDPQTQDRYHRSIPLDKALHPDTLLCYGMNGETLPLDHGYPVRAVIPGWYGMDSVKWLDRVEVLAEPDDNPRISKAYLRLTKPGGGMDPREERLTGMPVKAVFSRPLEGAILVGRKFRIQGAAWAGERRVSKVEVSVDGGASWRAARLPAS